MVIEYSQSAAIPTSSVFYRLRGRRQYLSLILAIKLRAIPIEIGQKLTTLCPISFIRLLGSCRSVFHIEGDSLISVLKESLVADGSSLGPITPVLVLVDH